MEGIGSERGIGREDRGGVGVGIGGGGFTCEEFLYNLRIAADSSSR